MNNSNRSQVSWDIVKTFTSNQCLVEVSMSSQNPKRYSYRLTWCEGDKRGAWFPDRAISFLDDVAKVVGEAEAWILDQRSLALADYEKRINERKESEAIKRKRHSENVERRREENRRSTASAKSHR